MQVHVFRMKSNVPEEPFDSTWDGPQTFVLAFFAPEFALQPAPLERLRAAFPHSFLLGCSTAGEILGPVMEVHSVVVAVVRFSSTRLCLVQADVASSSTSSREAGVKLGRALITPDLKGIFVLSSGINVSGSELAGGFNKVLPACVKISGGLAADGEELQEYVYHRGGAWRTDASFAPSCGRRGLLWRFNSPRLWFQWRLVSFRSGAQGDT